ncbi:MAG: peptidase M16, partial [Odoribacter sp.]|nr:peptidase M16 [Odoribacter sp.]
ITLDVCTNFYKTFFKPNIAYLAIVGDITLAEIKPLIEKYFGTWQKGDVPAAKYLIRERPASNTAAIVDRPNAVQSVISVCYPIDLKPGCDDAIKAKVMNTILGGGTFRLFTNLREKHSYTYGAYSSLSSDRLIGNFHASANVRNSVTDSAFTEILFEMNRLKSEKVPDEELSMIKNYMTGTFSLSLENAQTIANFALNIERYKLPKDYYANYLQNLAAVSADDVSAMATKYLKTDNLYVFAVGKASEVAEKLKKFSTDGKIKYYDIYGNPVAMENKIKPVPAGITAESVIKKYTEAIGGEKKLLKVKDLTMKMTTTMQGMALNIDTYRKAPNKLKSEIAMNGMILQSQIFDGTAGVTNSMQGSEEIKDKDLEDMKLQAVFNLELYYTKYNIKSELKGIE